MKITLITAILFLTFQAHSQYWMDVKPEARNEDKPSFYEYQKRFYDHWKEKDIVNGYFMEDGIEKKAYGWKQFKRWENFWESRVDRKTGAFPDKGRASKAVASFYNGSRSEEGDWVSLGPTESGGGYAGVGRINEIAFHPDDPNTFWTSSPQGGVWRTSNGGADWQVLTDEEDIMAATAIAVSPDFSFSQTLYLGTGDRDSWRHDSGIGVLKSTDGGNSWEQTGLIFDPADGYSVNRILIHPDDYQILFAATTNGLYKSYDGGDSWLRIYSEKYLIDLEFKPGDPSTLYASNKYWGRIYKFTDDGYDIDVVMNDYDFGAKRIELAISPANPNAVYALVANEDGGLKELLRSTNSGDSFSKILVPGPSLSKPNLLARDPEGLEEGGQAYFDLTLIVDPSNANHLYCGGINNWESFDGGFNWTLNNYWQSYGCQGCEIVHADKHHLAFNNGTLYECNDGGLYKSANGSTWSYISNGIVNSQIYKLGVSQISSNEVITGLQDNGTKLYSGNNWSDKHGGDGMECLIDYTNENIQYCETQNGNKLMRTTNHWGSKSDIKPEDSEGAWETPFIIDPVDPQTLYAGYQHIYKTTDRGNNWEIIFNQDSETKFRVIAISPSNTQVLYVSDANDMWRTTNGGTTWTNLTNNGIPDEMITSITVKHDDPNTLWITLGAYSENLVLQSTNGGDSWTNISGILPHIPANTLVQNVRSTDQVELYLGTDFGTFVKRGNNLWQPFNNGLPKLVVRELEIHYANIGDQDKLYAATYGRGLWVSDLLDTNLPPKADFFANKTNVSAGEAVLFTSASYHGPTSWEWTFEGATPSSSTNETQYVTYSEPGTYSVSLTVSNQYGTDTHSKTDYITVLCNALNYTATKAESVAGDYIDLGNQGMEIQTGNFDDANSDPVDIGFDFIYNCGTFSQFVLNTNGFIKLGNTPPSRADLFYDTATGNDNGVFNSNNSADVNLIIPFNHDLKGSAFPEFRVHTSGDAPDRVCTIQFEGLADKTTTPPQQYNNIMFQIKLYEGTNIIEFIYGDWKASSNESAFKSAACGLKGASNTDENLLVAGKNSSSPWTEIYFENANYIPGAYGLNFGNPPERPKPDKGRTFRFTPNLQNDVYLGPLYALATASINHSNPQLLSVEVKNIGSRAVTEFPVNLTITGANPFTDTKILPNLDPGESTIVDFDPYSPMELGESDFLVSIPDDDSNLDNVSAWSQHTSQTDINLSTDDFPVSVFGFGGGNEGIFASKYHINGTAQINSVNVFLGYYPSNVNQRVFAVLMDLDGNIIAQSGDLILTSTNMNKWRSFTFPEVAYFTDESFIAGLGLRKASNNQSYYVLGVQEEIPTRPASYYSTTINGGVLLEQQPSFGYRYMIGISASDPVLDGEATATSNSICFGETAQLQLSGNHTNMQWEQSSNGQNWIDVTGGSGANTQNYTTAPLEHSRYFRVRVDDGVITLYSNTVLIQVHQNYEFVENFNICEGEDFTFPDGTSIQDITENMNHISALTSEFGCDSIITTHLIVEPVYFDQEAVVVCNKDNYTFPDGHTESFITENMEHQSVFTTEAGCDSILETILTVHKIEISVEVSEYKLIASPSGMSYQWIDCDNGFVEVADETTQTFEPLLTGNYAVIVNDGSCADTSDCHFIIGTGTEHTNDGPLSLFPNPTARKVMLQNDQDIISEIRLFNTTGIEYQLTRINRMSPHSAEIDLVDRSPGIYFLSVQCGEQRIIKKLVVQ